MLASITLTSLLTLLCGKDLEIPVLSLACHLRLSQTAYCDLIAPSLLLTSESALAIMASYQGETPINAFDSPVLGKLLACRCLRTESTDPHSFHTLPGGNRRLAG